MGMAAAVPALISAGGFIGSKFAGDSARKSAMKQSPGEIAATGGVNRAAASQTQLADQFKQAGGDLLQTGTPAVRQSLSYYSTLLGGNRAAMAQAVAPETQQIGDVYKGAERSLVASGTRGAVRDQARGEIQREKTGRIAGLIGSVRPGAAAQLAGTGMSAIGAGAGALSGAAGATNSAGNLYSGLIGGAQQNRAMGNAAAGDASGQIGALVADLLKNNSSKAKK